LYLKAREAEGIGLVHFHFPNDLVMGCRHNQSCHHRHCGIFKWDSGFQKAVRTGAIDRSLPILRGRRNIQHSRMEAS
jgi:hypothetical protein